MEFHGKTSFFGTALRKNKINIIQTYNSRKRIFVSTSVKNIELEWAKFDIAIFAGSLSASVYVKRKKFMFLWVRSDSTQVLSNLSIQSFLPYSFTSYPTFRFWLIIRYWVPQSWVYSRFLLFHGSLILNFLLVKNNDHVSCLGRCVSLPTGSL